jgi:hypothetical protein
MDDNVLKQGSLLGLGLVLLFFVGVGLVYGLLTGVTEWGVGYRGLVALCIGPLPALIGFGFYWARRQPDGS